MPSQSCKVISNTKISDDNMWVMKVAVPAVAGAGAGEGEGFAHPKMGQFFMLRAWGSYPVLSRPISVHNVGDGYISFMYRVIGEGTKILSGLKECEEVSLSGPFGNGFPYGLAGKIALVGGGMGIAPLLFAARELDKPDIYLGFREEVLEENEYRPLAGKLVTRVGGTILDDVDYNAYDHIFVCGPLPMEKALVERAQQAGSKAKIYLSLEKHMACGMGACLVCSCATVTGNKKVCKDGPVFLADEVLLDEL